MVTDRQTDAEKLIDTFLRTAVANAPNPLNVRADTGRKVTDCYTNVTT